MYLGTIVEFVSSWPNDSGANPRFFWGPAGFWSLWKRNLRHCPPLSWRIRPEAFVLSEISSTTFLQQTLVLPPNSFLIEMQMHLSGWLHFPYSNWRMQLYPEFVDFPTSDFSCQHLHAWPRPAHSCWSQTFLWTSQAFFTYVRKNLHILIAKKKKSCPPHPSTPKKRGFLAISLWAWTGAVTPSWRYGLWWLTVNLAL